MTIQITNKIELMNIGIDENLPLYGQYELIQDIDCGNWAITIGDESHPFSGQFNGNGYTIRNLGHSSAGTTGLFYSVLNGASVHNLAIDNVVLSVIGADTTLGYGAIARGNQGSISNCIVTNCSVVCSDPLPPEYHVGGLVGISSGSILNCFFSGNFSPLVSNELSSLDPIAGISYQQILCCYYDSTITGIQNSANATALSTSEAKLEASFPVDWFAGEQPNWKVPNNDYPHLQEFLAAPVVNVRYTKSTSVKLGWEPVVGADGYKVFISTDNGSSYIPWPDQIINPLCEVYTVETLTPLTSYFFVVKAVRGGSYFSDESVAVSTTTLETDPVPIKITTSQDLWEVMGNLDADFELTNNIVFGETPQPGMEGTFSFGAESWGTPAQAFTGTFDGKGYVIYNVATKTGLFDHVAHGAVVKNLGIKNITFAPDGSDASGHFGAIARINHGTISNCFVDGIVVAPYWAGTNAIFGGIAGTVVGETQDNCGTISNCFVSGNFSPLVISSPDYTINPVVGTKTDGQLFGITLNCYYDSDVVGVLDIDGDVDGIIGLTTSAAKIEGSYPATWFSSNEWEVLSGNYPTLEQPEIVPDAPAISIRDAGVSASKIILEWSPIEHANGYKVFVANSSDGVSYGGYSQIPESLVQLSWGSYTVSGLSNNTFYRLKVLSSNLLHDSVDSNIVEAKTALADIPQDPYPFFDTTTSTIKIIWTWDAIATYEIWVDGIEMENPPTSPVMVENIYGGPWGYYELGGMQPNTGRVIEIIARNSSYPEYYFATGNQYARTSPPRPVCEIIQKTQNSITLTLSHLETCSFEITGILSYTYTFESTSPSTVCLLPSLEANTLYSLNIVARNQDGFTSDPLELSVQTSGNIPSVFMNDVATDSIQIKWLADPYATSYEVVAIINSEPVSFTPIPYYQYYICNIIGLTPNTSYSISVTPYIDGTPSEAYTGTFLTRATPPVLNANTIVTSTQLHLAWNEIAGASYGLSGYGEYEIQIEAGTTSWTAPSVVANHGYSLGLIAKNASGDSDRRTFGVTTSDTPIQPYVYSVSSTATSLTVVWDWDISATYQIIIKDKSANVIETSPIQTLSNNSYPMGTYTTSITLIADTNYDIDIIATNPTSTLNATTITTGKTAEAEAVAVGTLGELLSISTAPDSVYKLVANIDCQGQSVTIGSLATPFAGTIYGHGYTVYNFASTSGLFGALGTTAKISKLGISDATIINNDGLAIGALAGTNQGTVSDCFAVKSSISGTGTLGGIIGDNSSGAVARCLFVGALSGVAAQPIAGSGTTSNSYYSPETTGVNTVNDGSVLLAANAIYQESSYVGWDFVGTWWGREYVSKYPCLQHTSTNLDAPVLETVSSITFNETSRQYDAVLSWNAVVDAARYLVIVLLDDVELFSSYVNGIGTTISVPPRYDGKSYGVKVRALSYDNFASSFSGTQPLNAPAVVPAVFELYDYTGDNTFNSVSVSWQSDPTVSSYVPAVNGVDVSGVSLDAGTSSYVFALTTPYTKYTLSVRAINNAGTATATTEAWTLPASLPNTFETIATYNSISISIASGETWGLQDPNHSYEILAKRTSDSEWEWAGSLYQGQSSSIINTLGGSSICSDVNYEVKLCVVIGSGRSEYSNPIQIRTLISPPLKPVNFHVTTKTGTSIALGWEVEPDSTVATSYEIYYSYYKNYVYYDGVINVNGGVNSHVITGLQLNTDCSFQIQAINSSGTFGYTSAILAKTLPADAPSTLGVKEVTSTSAILYWTPTIEAISYKIKNMETAEVYSTTGTSQILTGLLAEHRHIFQIASITAHGMSEYRTIEVTTLSGRVPPKADISVLSISATAVQIIWQPVSDATKYEIYAGENGLETWRGETTSTTYSIPVLLPGVNYSIYIKAFGAGETYVSQSASISQATLLEAPTGLRRTDNSTTSLGLAWNAVSGASSYIIYKDNVQYGTSISPSIEIDNLMTETMYSFKVKAINAATESEFSKTWTTMLQASTMATCNSRSICIRPNGSLVIFGNDYINGLSPLDERLLKIDNAVAVAAGGVHALILLSEATDDYPNKIASLGTNSNQQLDLPADINNPVAIACTDVHSLILQSDGIIKKSLGDYTYTWSYLEGGGGSADITTVPSEFQSPSTAIAIATGSLHSIALRTDGTAFAWGNHEYAQTEDIRTILSIPETVLFVGVAASGARSWYITNDGWVIQTGYPGYSSGRNPHCCVRIAALSEDAHPVAVAGGGTNGGTVDKVLILMSDGSIATLEFSGEVGAMPIVQYKQNGNDSLQRMNWLEAPTTLTREALPPLLASINDAIEISGHNNIGYCLIRKADGGIVGYNYSGVAEDYGATEYPTINSPSGIVISATSPTSRTLVWETVPEASHYAVFKRIKGTSVWSRIETQSSITQPNFVVVGLAANTEYEFKVEAVQVTRLGGNRIILIGASESVSVSSEVQKRYVLVEAINGKITYNN